LTDLVLFYSGFDSTDRLKRLIEVMENGFNVSGVLVTFIGLEGSVMKYLKLLKKEYDVKLMLDSGAFSFNKALWWMNGIVKFEPSEKVLRIMKYKRYDWYFRKYLRFLKRNIDLFDVYAELDLQLVVGTEKVNEWREMFIKEGLEPVLVWHGENEKGVIEMLQYGDKFGFPWKQLDKRPEDIMQLVRFVKKNGAKWIHWFGMTRWNVLRQLSLEKILNSADSTAWASAQRYGVVYVIDGESQVKSLQISFNSKRGTDDKKKVVASQYRKFLEQNKEKIIELGLDYEKIFDLKDWREVSFMNLLVFQWGLEELNKELKSGKRFKYLDLEKHMRNGNGVFDNMRLKLKRKDIDLGRWLS